MCKSQEANDRMIEQDQADQVRRTTGATLAALGTTHSNPAERDRAAKVLETALTEAFPNAGNHRKAGRKMAEDMGKAGVTPGPWRVSDENHTRVQAGQLHIAETCGMDRDNTDANARLIAAAPDLFAALEECITDDNSCCMNTGQRERRLKAIDAIARAALAKAGGV